jgi:uncharacterized protein YccT (UPF0319 family)
MANRKPTPKPEVAEAPRRRAVGKATAPGQLAKTGIRTARDYAQERAAYNKAAGAREDAAAKKVATAKRVAGSNFSGKSVIDQIGDFFRDRADRLTGK